MADSRPEIESEAEDFISRMFPTHSERWRRFCDHFSNPLRPESDQHGPGAIPGCTLSPRHEYVLKTLEDFVSTIIRLQKATEWSDWAHILWDFVRLRTGKSTISSIESVYIHLIDAIRDAFSVQQQGFLEDSLSFFRNCLDSVELFEKSAIASKVYDLFCYLLANGLFSFSKIPILTREITVLFSDYKESRYSSKLGFVQCLLDFGVFLFERLSTYFATGSIKHAFFTEADVADWFVEVQDLTRLSLNYSNLSSFGWDQYSFIVRLDDAISRGAGYLQALKRSSRKDVNFVAKQMQALKLIRENNISRAEASKFRDPPCSFLLFGTSNIGKTLFMQNLIAHLCKVMNWPIDDRQMYSFVPGVKHHDGCFDGKRIIIMDELSPENPNKVTDVGNSSLGDVLKINNTAPFILPTAALELKGKVTFRPQLVVGSTNVKHLNAHLFYQCPLAVRRRFPYIVELQMKAQYSTDGMLDPSKVPPSVGYADIWHIKIWKVGAKVAQDPVKYEAGEHGVSETLVLETRDSAEAFAFLGSVAVDHFANVKKAREAHEEGKNVEICRKDVDGVIKGCFMPLNRCLCMRVQAGEGEESFVSPNTQVAPPSLRWHIPVPYPFRLHEWYRFCVSLGGDARWDHRLTGANILRFRVVIWMALFLSLLFPGFMSMVLTGIYGAWIAQCADIEDSRGSWLEYGYTGVIIIVHFLLVSPASLISVAMLYLAYTCWSNTLWRVTLMNFITYARMVKTDGFTKANGYMLFLSVRIVGRRVEECLKSYLPNDVVAAMAFFGAGFVIGKTLTTAVKKTVQVITSRRDPPPAAPLNIEEILKEEPVGSLSEEVLGFDDDFSLQNGEEEEEIPERPDILVEEKEPANVWYKENFELTPLHLTPISKSFKSMDQTTLVERLRDNLYCLSVYRPDRERMWSRGKMFCIHENFFVTQKHFFVTGFPARCRMYKVGAPRRDDGIKDFQEFWLDKSSIKHEQGELLIVWLPAIRMGKSCLGLLSAQPLGGSHEGVLIRRQPDVAAPDIMMSRILYGRHDIPDLNLGESDYAAWFGNVHSMDGDCASPLLVFTHYGPVIYGFHVAGSVAGTPRGYAQRLDLGLVLTALRQNGVDVKRSIVDACLPLSAESAPRTLEDLHFKSPVRFILNGNAEVYGSLSGARAAPKSMVGKTPLCDLMLAQGFEMKWGRPILHGWQPKHRVLSQACRNASQWRVPLLSAMTEEYCRRFEKSTTPGGCSPLSTNDAINGVDGVRFLEAMPRKTSAGYPWNKSKLHFLIRSGDKVFLNEEMERRVEFIERNALNGIITYPIFTASLKDEPLKLAKIEEFATRVFYGSPMDYTIVSRKYFMPMIRFIQQNAQIFGSYPGVNCHSPQWEMLARNLVAKCGYANVSAIKVARCRAHVNDGDYKMFDVSFESELLYFVFEVFRRIVVHIGYNDRDVLACRTLLMAVFNGYINFFGDLISLHGIVLSGLIFTVLVNCTGNILAVMYCYYSMRPRECHIPFFEAVFIATYGDDNLMGISPRVPWFNHMALARELEKVGFTFTMADKTGIPVPYRMLQDVSFLKRSFRYDPDFGFIVAPIEEASIIKSLMICVRSKSVTPQDQLMSQIRSAVREYAYYGKDIYEQKVNWLRDAISSLGLEHMIVPSTFPPFERIVEDFRTSKLFGHCLLTE